MSQLENYFKPFRDNTIGTETKIPLAEGGETQLVYADWIASGRLYKPIEEYLTETIGPLVANTHTETSYTGTAMTSAYHKAREIIRTHVNAGPNDSLILGGFGMTAVVNKLQRILGLRYSPCENEKEPVVLVTHMEHHSNQITWEECNAEVVIIPREETSGLPDLNWLEKMLKKYSERQIYASITACSNVTGIITPYHKIARLVHRYGGHCFVDFAASAPYVDIDMHPSGDPEASLDAVLFSPHKFLGGPGTSGVLVMNNNLYHNPVPDQPGGGTVKWTTPFGTHAYYDEIEVREDGGTPGFLQAIRVAFTLILKDKMGTDKIHLREEELKKILLDELGKHEEIMLLEAQGQNRLGIISFYAKGIHHNLIVRLLNDYFGIQTRGGCSCAGTYGHILFNINKTTSAQIADLINSGDLSQKPGWVRVSLHPTMSDREAKFIGQAIIRVLEKHKEWEQHYQFDEESGEYIRKAGYMVPDLISSFTVSPPNN